MMFTEKIIYLFHQVGQAGNSSRNAANGLASPGRRGCSKRGAHKVPSLVDVRSEAPDATILYRYFVFGISMLIQKMRNASIVVSWSCNV
jgi:hypothetical protein